MNRERGVTLIELLIVVAIIGVLVGVTFPSVASAIDGLRLRNAADGIAGFLQSAVNRTERTQRMLELTITRAANQLTLAGENYSTVFQVTGGVRIAEVLPAIAGDPDAPRHYLLYPGGAPPRVRVRLVNAKGATRTVWLDNLTGIARVEGGEAQ